MSHKADVTCPECGVIVEITVHDGPPGTPDYGLNDLATPIGSCTLLGSGRAKVENERLCCEALEAALDEAIRGRDVVRFGYRRS